MLSYALRRIVIVAITLLAASIIVFAVLEIVPGDPARLMLGINATDDAVAALRQQMGLDQPLVLRYFEWIGGMLTGDFGRSYTYSVPVIDLIRERLVVSLPAGIYGAPSVDRDSHSCRHLFGGAARLRRRRRRDAATQLGIAIPNFWFAILLVYVFAIALRLVPAGGFPAGMPASARRLPH